MTEEFVCYLIFAAMFGVIAGLIVGCWIGEVRTRNLVCRLGNALQKGER